MYFRDSFNELSKQDQDLVMTSHVEAHRRVDKKHKFITYMYQGVEICQSMYLFIYNISRKRFQNITRHFDNEGLCVQRHRLCGKSSNNKRENCRLEKHNC